MSGLPDDKSAIAPATRDDCDRPATWAIGLMLVLAGGYLLALGTLAWLTMAPPAEFPGFARDTATAEAPGRLALFADRFGARPWTGSVDRYLWAIRGLWVALFAAHGAIVWFLAGRLRRLGRPWLWAALPVLALAVGVLYPPTSADLFYYAISGSIAVNHGENPYLVAPAAFPNDPLLPFNFWTGITSPYGPLWTTFARGVVAAVGTDPFRVAIAFKMLAAVAALGLAALAARLAERRHGGSGWLVGVAVGLQPTLVLESAGTGHHDALVGVLTLLGGWLLGRGRLRWAVVAVTGAVLIKPVVAPLLAALLLMRLRESSWSRLVRAWLGDLLAFATLTAIVAAPYWADGAMVRSMLDEPGRLVSHPLYSVAAEAVGSWAGAKARVSFGDWARTGSQAMAAGIVGALLLRFAWRQRRAASDQTSREATVDPAELLSVWMAIAVVLAIVPANAHPWYAIWALGPVAVITAGRGRWFMLFLIALALLGIGYHTDVSG